jgi:adenylate cyclase
LSFGLIWLISGLVFLIVELAATGSFSQLPDTAIRIDFEIFLWSSIAITTVGLLIGFIEIKYLDHVFTHQNFAIRFIFKLLVYSFLFLLIIFITYPLAVSLELNTNLMDRRVWEKFMQYFTSITHLSTTLQLATAIILILIRSERNEASDFLDVSCLKSFNIQSSYMLYVLPNRKYFFNTQKQYVSKYMVILQKMISFKQK